MVAGCRLETDKSTELRELAQRVADALPPDVAQEVIVTGSVSRGMADDVSDIEMLVVTPEVLPLETCFEHARAAGLTNGSAPRRGRTTARRGGFQLDTVELAPGGPNIDRARIWLTDGVEILRRSMR